MQKKLINTKKSPNTKNLPNAENVLNTKNVPSQLRKVAKLYTVKLKTQNWNTNTKNLNFGGNITS